MKSFVKEHPNEYTKELLRKFYDYWSEPTKSKKQIRYDLEKTWDLKKRLDTFVRNEDKFEKKNGNGNGYIKPDTTIIRDRVD